MAAIMANSNSNGKLALGKLALGNRQQAIGHHKFHFIIKNSIKHFGAIMEFVIDGRVVRAILKCKESKAYVDTLVDPVIKDEFLQLFNLVDKKESENKEFDLRDEFRETYALVKGRLNGAEEIESNLLNTAHKFLQFMLANEVKLNGIESVKAFKSAVFQVLDSYNPELRSEIIDKFNALVEA